MKRVLVQHDKNGKPLKAVDMQHIASLRYAFPHAWEVKLTSGIELMHWCDDEAQMDAVMNDFIEYKENEVMR